MTATTTEHICELEERLTFVLSEDTLKSYGEYRWSCSCGVPAGAWTVSPQIAVDAGRQHLLGVVAGEAGA